jgi:hypothetical protein
VIWKLQFIDQWTYISIHWNSRLCAGLVILFVENIEPFQWIQPNRWNTPPAAAADAGAMASLQLPDSGRTSSEWRYCKWWSRCPDVRYVCHWGQENNMFSFFVFLQRLAQRFACDFSAEEDLKYIYFWRRRSIPSWNSDPSAKNISKKVLINPPWKRTGGFGYTRPL